MQQPSTAPTNSLKNADRISIGSILDHPEVYRLFDRRSRLLYVGSTVNVGRRLAEHARIQRWWRHVVSVTRTSHPTIAEARAAETQAIGNEGPLHNKAIPIDGEFGSHRRGVVALAEFTEAHRRCMTGGGDYNHDQPYCPDHPDYAAAS